MGVSAKSSLPSAPPALPERYAIRRHIASGGMASVWCAEDRLLGRTVAVKVLAERFAHDDVAVRRFQREARTAARVSAHPHVVTIFDVGDIEPSEEDVKAGREPASRAFIVMEFLSGGTVADAIRVGAVDRDDAIRWLDEAASALDHAQLRGIVHRDIKPANFLLDGSRVLHVADFGIARLQSDDTITSSGELFGTAAYLSPEQALGEEATSASDRYSLTVAAFELLAGRRPFQTTNFAAQARQHVEDEVPRASRDRPLTAASGRFDPDPRHGQAPRGSLPQRRRIRGRARGRPRGRPGASPDDEDGSDRGVPAATAAPRPAGRPRRPGRRRRSCRGPCRPRRSGRLFALAALAVVVAGIAALAAFGHGGSNHSAAIASHTSTHQPTAAGTVTAHKRGRSKAATSRAPPPPAPPRP